MNKQVFTETEFVTAWIAGQLFGIPITRVHDVFEAERITHVPLAPAEISGVLNLRGRVVTAFNMRTRLGLPPRENAKKQMAIGIDHDGEAYGLLVDSMGEVLKFSADALDAVPSERRSQHSPVRCAANARCSARAIRAGFRTRGLR